MTPAVTEVTCKKKLTVFLTNGLKNADIVNCMVGYKYPK